MVVVVLEVEITRSPLQGTGAEKGQKKEKCGIKIRVQFSCVLLTKLTVDLMITLVVVMVAVVVIIRRVVVITISNGDECNRGDVYC